MDIHRDIDMDAAAFDEAKREDIEVQTRHGVDHRMYWIDEDEGVAFCLFDAPSKEAGETVHREAHGRIAHEIYEVQQGGDDA